MTSRVPRSSVVNARGRSAAACTLPCLLLLLAVACADRTRGGGAADGGAADAGAADAGDPSKLPYARDVVSFKPGAHAGFGQDSLPGIVLGPPVGGGTDHGSLDVLSLGKGGEIVLGFGANVIENGDGPDFIVFENAFWPSGDASAVYTDLGEVAVSEDAKSWKTFACDVKGDGHGHFPGCAGWSPTLEYDAFALLPLDPKRSGGDAFDLADVGSEHARYVRIHDLAAKAEGTSAGFDLDAAGIIHSAPLP